MSDPRELTSAKLDELYNDIFEVDKRGQAILMDLHNRFSKGPARGFTQESMLETFARAHQRAIVEYILNRINRHNGAGDLPDPPEPNDVPHPS